MKSPSRLPMYLGAVLVAAGWLALYVAWDKAGSQDLETGQLPFILSGGFGAAGLIVLGVTAIIVDVLRRAQWQAAQDASSLRHTLDDLTAAVTSLVERQAPEPADEQPRRPRPAARRSRTSRPSA